MTDSKDTLESLEQERLQQAIDRVELAIVIAEKLAETLKASRGAKAATSSEAAGDLLDSLRYVQEYLAALRGRPEAEEATEERRESIPFQRTR